MSRVRRLDPADNGDATDAFPGSAGGYRLQSRTSMSQEISSIIRQAIIDGDLLPGRRIVESKLAHDLGVSLTPVREAVRQLVGEGILTIEPNKGPSVRILTVEDAFELYSLRAMLEGLAIRLAVARPAAERAVIQGIFENMVAAVDDDAVDTLLAHATRIHEGIVALSRHERLITMYRSLLLQISVLNRVAGKRSTKQHEVDWHRPLVEGLLGDDRDHAEAVMREHIFESYRNYLETVGHAATGAACPDWF
jgi:DNA-binding GntR family transcriptional regulator